MRHRLWEKVRYQHTISAPSAWSAITHQTSKSVEQSITLTVAITRWFRRFMLWPSSIEPFGCHSAGLLRS